MNSDVLKHILKSRDKFQAVVEYNGLYRSASEFNSTIESLNSWSDEHGTLEDRINIGLGVVFMKRTRSNDTTEQLFSAVDALQEAAAGNRDLCRRCKIVRMTIMIVRTSHYSDAYHQLNAICGKLNDTKEYFSYGMASWFLGISCVWMGNQREAEFAYQDALSIFRRFGHGVHFAFVSADYGVFKKRICQYEEAKRLLIQALESFESVELSRGIFAACNNLGVVCKRTGNWKEAERYYARADAALRDLVEDSSDMSIYLVRVLRTNASHLEILTRNFENAELMLSPIAKYYGKENGRRLRLSMLGQELLGELHFGLGDYDKAIAHLLPAFNIVKDVLPETDVDTEISRRLAEAFWEKGEHEKAREIVFECVRMSKRIGDRYELGASLRVLGEIFSSEKEYGKASACFNAALRGLKSIGERYEYMKTCLSYAEFLVEYGRKNAELYLLEARHLCRELDDDYFLVKTIVGLAKWNRQTIDFETARILLMEASERHGRLPRHDSKQLNSLLSQEIEKLDAAVLKLGVSAATEIQKICRVYEDARFPLENIKPDLAYRVSQSVGADSLFLIRRKGRGYAVPLAYNIPVDEAKEVVRRLDRDHRKPILGVAGDPVLHRTHFGSSLICVPTPRVDGMVLCTCMPRDRWATSRHYEYLVASAEALERLVESDDEKPDSIYEGFMVSNGSATVSHPRGSFKEILTVTSDTMKLIHLAERASLSEETILLEGETGVGKELFAQAIHANSRRNERPFVAINSGGMPVSLLESQLFGHVKGAFTDAVKDRTGLIEEADGGTLFLDEVGEMGPELQVKLLRLLENGEYRRLGENDVRVANVRVVSATNRDLMEEVGRGVFRRDLYYRLGTIKLHIPALRFRLRDIEMLARHFLRECAVRYGQSDRYFEFDIKAREALELYNWPGNVRELQNEIRRIVSLIGDANVIRFGMLSQSIKEYVKSKNRGGGPLERNVERYERRLILDALSKNDWNRLRTAEELGLPRTTLLAKMRRLNVAAR